MTMSDSSGSVGYDTPSDASYRIYASISFAILLLGVGVPLWWHTTAVPRVTLPYDGIARLSNLDIKISTRILVAALTENRAKLLEEEINRELKSDELYNLQISHMVISSNLVSSAITIHDLEKIANNFDVQVGELLLLEVPNLSDGVLAGSHRTIFFSPEASGVKLSQVLSNWILLNKSVTLTRNALAEPTQFSLDKQNRRRFPASSAYDVLLTLVNPYPDKLTVDWHLPTVIKEYIEPFLDDISMVANFTVKSQWLYLVPLDVTPKQIPDSSVLGRHYALPEDVLPQIITPLEKKLASQVSLNPCINLVMYTPPCDKAPLHIYTRSGHRSKTASNVEAFLSPRWGGVVIANPPTESCIDVEDNQMITFTPEASSIMGVFIAHLRLLLGIPDKEPIPGAALVRLDNSKPRDWELDALLRIRAVEQLTSAKLTLQSLAQLLEEISNIVITDTVGDRINGALKWVEDSADKLRHGKLLEGYASSKEAFVTAEAAFTDPSLLALLYFPDDQKYAVYIPLFLPVMIPVLLSLRNIWRYFISKIKENKTNKVDLTQEAKEIDKSKTD
ncbi:GPI transamidase component PIG-S [Diprion similis]|uniref:GPI transamidase component PIG-S n=1 Tax=Diprion similis TaxID=362088 RepID=UPI001EF84C11|nr:GPI transamidase component PIG-S [Diprion similis]XP_046740186.1 GPI transamidase component PIG-S [Diprion similis]